MIPPGDDHCTGIVVNPSSTCSMQVQFSPAAAGYITGTLTYTDSRNVNYVVALAGYAATVAVSSYADPTVLDFPGQVLTTTSSVLSFSIFNNGNTPLTVGALTGTNTIVGTNGNRRLLDQRHAGRQRCVQCASDRAEFPLLGFSCIHANSGGCGYRHHQRASDLFQQHHDVVRDQPERHRQLRSRIRLN